MKEKKLKLTNKELFKNSDYSKNIKLKKFITSNNGIENYKITLKNNLLVLLKCKKFNNEDEFISEIKRCLIKKEIDHSYILKFLDYSSGKIEGFCNINYWINYYVEYPIDTLNNIIKNNYLKKKNFDQEFIIHWLYQQINAGYFLQKKGLYHGDICPQNIVIYENDNISKIKDNDYEIKVKNSFYIQKLKYLKKNDLYISPILYDSIITSTNNFNYNKFKEDVYSLGLIILEITLLENIQNIYNKLNGKFDENKLKYYLNKFENLCDENQNELLKSTIKVMLLSNEEDRPDFNNLISNLPDYKDIINYFYMNNTKEEELLRESNFSFSDINVKELNNFNKNKENNLKNSYQPVVNDKKENNNNKEFKSDKFCPNNFKEEDNIQKKFKSFEDYKKDPNYEVYFNEDYKRHYFLNNITKECDWIYLEEEWKLINKNN